MTRIAKPFPAALAALALCAAVALAEKPAPVADPLYFPSATGAWETTTPAQAGWDAEALDAALAYAGEERSSGVVVLHRGRILAERYWKLAPDPDDPQDRVHQMTTGTTGDGQAIEDVASVQKSVISFLAGVARGKGLLDFDAPVNRYLEKGWSRATPEQEAAITVRHLLAMASGLAIDGSYQADPGAKWMYNTSVYANMVRILERASGLSVDEYTRRWLTEPIGMADSRWTPRPWAAGTGADANAIGFSSSARDLARFGLLVLGGGRWDGRDLLGDPTYFPEAFRSSQTHNPSYGLLWWLNGKERSRPGAGENAAGPLITTAPADLVAAQGALGRRVFVVPSLELVVTRLGDEPARGFDTELWRRLMTAAPPTGSARTGG